MGILLFAMFFVMKENSYLSRTVEVEEGQKVISTGPYSVVRHPMYTGVLLGPYSLHFLAGLFSLENSQ